MKIVILMSLLLFTATSNAQFGKRLLEQTKESAKRKAEQKVQQKIDNTIDLGINKTDSALASKKKKRKKGKEENSRVDLAGENNAENSVNETKENLLQPASKTVITPEGSAFADNKLSLSSLFYNENTGSFDPEPNDDLDAAGAAMRQQLKTKKILIKIYQRLSGDNPAKAEEEYTAIKLYLVNRYSLDADRIFFYSPSTKKDGPLRMVVFTAVPETFKATEASKY